MERTWTAVVRPATGPAVGRVVVLPHAGAGPLALQPLVAQLPAAVTVVGVTLPGRERRFEEPFAATPSDPLAVVAAVLAEITDRPAPPTVLFGHSMGATMAEALAIMRPEAFVGVVLSAYPTPDAAGPLRRWTDEELMEILRRGALTPTEIITSRPWRRHVLDVLRSDFTLAVRLAHLHAGQRFEVPLTVLSGEQDDVAPERPETVWRERAGAGLRTARYPGQHFYLLDAPNTAAVAAEIAAPLAVTG